MKDVMSRDLSSNCQDCDLIRRISGKVISRLPNLRGVFGRIFLHCTFLSLYNTFQGSGLRIVNTSIQSFFGAPNDALRPALFGD